MVWFKLETSLNIIQTHSCLSSMHVSYRTMICQIITYGTLELVYTWPSFIDWPLTCFLSCTVGKVGRAIVT